MSVFIRKDVYKGQTMKNEIKRIYFLYVPMLFTFYSICALLICVLLAFCKDSQSSFQSTAHAQPDRTRNHVAF